MSKHTPGPWSDKGKDGKFLDGGAWNLECTRAGTFHWVPIKAGRKNIAIVMSRGWPENSNVAANARLIAAAPDLLSALEAVRRDLQIGDGRPTLATAGMMVQAIAKAKGETP